MKTLKESLLSNVETTLSVDSAYTKLYQAPKASDFKKNPFGGTKIDWICPLLINEYIDALGPFFTAMHHEKAFIGIRVSIHDKHELSVYLINSVADFDTAGELPGIGSDGSSIPTQKKEIIEFFNYITNNPSELKRLFEYVNKRNVELNKYKVCDCWSLKEILKF